MKTSFVHTTGILCLFLFLPACLHAQSLSINTDGSAANPSAILDIKSINKGLLIPRLTTAQIAALVTPPQGLLVYVTDAAAGFYHYNISDWAKTITQDGTGSGNVAINQTSTNAHPSAMLDIQPTLSNNKGLLIPRLTGAQTAGIASPALGLMVYVTDGAAGHYTYNVTDWAKTITQDGTGTGNVAINQTSTNAHPSAILDIQPTLSLNKGLLIPRLTSAQTASIASPAQGLMVYVTDGSAGLYHYNITDWAKTITQDGTGTGNVAINQTSTNADPSAILDIQPTLSRNKGLLIPKLTNAQRGTIASPATGLLIFQTDATAGFYHYTGSNWVKTVTENATGNVGIGCVTPQYKLHVIGDIASSATVRGLNVFAAGAITACSDGRYKKNVLPIKNSLNQVMNMQGVTYNWKTNEFPGKHFLNDLQIGFIAQDIEKIVPQVVTTDTDGYKGIDYGRLTPLLVESIKEQQKMIGELQTKNSGLKDEIDQMKTEIKLIMSSLKCKDLADNLNHK